MVAANREISYRISATNETAQAASGARATLSNLAREMESQTILGPMIKPRFGKFEQDVRNEMAVQIRKMRSAGKAAAAGDRSGEVGIAARDILGLPSPSETKNAVKATFNPLWQELESAKRGLVSSGREMEKGGLFPFIDKLKKVAGARGPIKDIFEILFVGGGAVAGITFAVKGILDLAKATNDFLSTGSGMEGYFYKSTAAIERDTKALEARRDRMYENIRIEEDMEQFSVGLNDESLKIHAATDRDRREIDFATDLRRTIADIGRREAESVKNNPGGYNADPFIRAREQANENYRDNLQKLWDEIEQDEIERFENKKNEYITRAAENAEREEGDKLKNRLTQRLEAISAAARDAQAQFDARIDTDLTSIFGGDDKPKLTQSSGLASAQLAGGLSGLAEQSRARGSNPVEKKLDEVKGVLGAIEKLLRDTRVDLISTPIA